jgi:hypothetical protein
VCTGSNPVTCTASDACHVAGTCDPSTGTCSNPPAPSNTPACGSTPAYSWSGVLQPINADGSSVFKLGSTVAVKFALTGVSAGITNLAATLTLAKISSTIVGTDMEAVSTSAASTGNAFRYDSIAGQYIFNLSTKTMSTGSWRLSINLGDGVSRTVTISLK